MRSPFERIRAFVSRRLSRKEKNEKSTVLQQSRLQRYLPKPRVLSFSSPRRSRVANFFFFFLKNGSVPLLLSDLVRRESRREMMDEPISLDLSFSIIHEEETKSHHLAESVFISKYRIARQDLPVSPRKRNKLVCCMYVCYARLWI